MQICKAFSALFLFDFVFVSRPQMPMVAVPRVSTHLAFFFCFRRPGRPVLVVRFRNARALIIIMINAFRVVL
uniref:Putative secreted protein n=1 Tax=Anopheles triannulatus TaxID=58253 RepID=A0A2M4B621_9DIPT